MATSQDPLSWRNSDIVRLCMSTPHFAGSIHGGRLIKISAELVVKFGLGVLQQEAENTCHKC
jgi:hypothetical protein